MIDFIRNLLWYIEHILQISIEYDFNVCPHSNSKYFLSKLTCDIFFSCKRLVLIVQLVTIF